MKSILKLVPLVISAPLLAQQPPLDKIITDTSTFWEIPGCAVSIVRGDEVLLCKGYGLKQLNAPKDKRNTIDAYTHFPIASITKIFTATAFGILLDRNLVTLDTPVQKFYPLKLSDSYAISHLTYRD